MAVERHLAAGRELARLRLADVVQQRCEAQHDVRRGQLGVALVRRPLEVDRVLEHLDRVVEDVLVLVRVVALELQGRQFRQHELGEAALDEQLDARARGCGRQQLHELVAHALGRDVENAPTQLANRLERGEVEVEAELRGETHGPKHP